MAELNTHVPRMWKRTVTFSGVGDNSTDNATAFTDLASNTLAYDRIVFPPGIYKTSGLIKFDTKHNITIDGWGATIHSTTPANGSFWIHDSDDVQINGIVHKVDSTARLSSWESNGWTFTYCSRLEVNGLQSHGAAATGFTFEGCLDSVARDCEAYNTRADGFHMTGGCMRMRVFRPIIHNPGDDGVSIVSYASNDDPNTDIRVVGARVYWQTGGRGLTIVGGTNCHYSDFYIYGSRAAGLMIAVEGPPPNADFTTKGISDCSAVGGQIVHCNAAAASEAHGGILILNQRPSSSGVSMVDVLVAEIEVRDMPRTDVAVINVLNNGQTTATVTNARLRNILLSGNRATTPIVVDSGITLAEQGIFQGGKWSTYGVA